jgi:hypothetical protein
LTLALESAPGLVTQPLNLKRDLLVSNFAFKFNLYRYNVGAELAVGRLAAARRVFLRAIDACPWDKAIWLQGGAIEVQCS